MPETPSTRERILDTGAALLRCQGAAATGLKQITSQSGAPWGSLYHYFPDGKDQLVAETLARVGERYRRAMSKAFVGVDSPGAAVARYFAAAADNLVASGFTDGCPVGTVTLEVASTNERLRGACAEVFAVWERTLADGFVAAGISEAAARDLATLFLVNLEGALVLSRARHDAAALRRAGAVVAAAVDAELPRPARCRRSGTTQAKQP